MTADLTSFDPADPDGLRRRARDYGRAHLQELSAMESNEPNRQMLRAMASAGLFTYIFGSADSTAHTTSAAALCAIREGLAEVSTSAETAFALQGLGGQPVVRFGSSEVREKWLPPLRTGDAIAAFALTEAGAGSDAAALSLRAAKAKDGFELSGEKIWISNAPHADIYTVFARTGPDERSAKGVTAFAVAGDSAGLSGESIDLIAPHPIGKLTFDRVHVRSDQILGHEGDGFSVAMRTLDIFRPSVGACAVGIGQAALDCAVERAAERDMFGKKQKQLQAISHSLADVATRIEAARLLVRQAAAKQDAGADDVTVTAAMAKLFATETAQEAVDAAIQTCGAMSLRHGHLLEHLYRDVRALRIYEGASEVQREIIGRHLFSPVGHP